MSLSAGAPGFREHPTMLSDDELRQRLHDLEAFNVECTLGNGKAAF